MLEIKGEFGSTMLYFARFTPLLFLTPLEKRTLTLLGLIYVICCLVWKSVSGRMDGAQSRTGVEQAR
jgi:hypothetical protein